MSSTATTAAALRMSAATTGDDASNSAPSSTASQRDGGKNGQSGERSPSWSSPREGAEEVPEEVSPVPVLTQSCISGNNHVLSTNESGLRTDEQTLLRNTTSSVLCDDMFSSPQHQHQSLSLSLFDRSHVNCNSKTKEDTNSSVDTNAKKEALTCSTSSPHHPNQQQQEEATARQQPLSRTCSITHQPTLLPNNNISSSSSTSLENHDSQDLTSGTADVIASSCSGLRLPPSHDNAARVDSSASSSLPTTIEEGRQTMGYNHNRTTTTSNSSNNGNSNTSMTRPNAWGRDNDTAGSLFAATDDKADDDAANASARPNYDHLGAHVRRNTNECKDEQQHDDGDSTTVRSTDSTNLLLQSPAMASLQGQDLVEGEWGAATPTTVSTAQSTDLSVGGWDTHFALDRLALQNYEPQSMQQPPLQMRSYHRRAQSWENASLHAMSSSSQQQPYTPNLPQHNAYSTQAVSTAHSAWGNNALHANRQPQQQQVRVASFRQEQQGYHSSSPAGAENRWYHQQQQQQQHPQQQPLGVAHRHAQVPFLPQRPSPHTDARFYPRQAQQHQPGAGPSPYSQSEQQPQRLSLTPPRHRSGPRMPGTPNQVPRGASSQAPPGGGPPTGGGGGGGARSSSEILKTLLRKKACLYEPDTSRAVALATWLVGRALALDRGYFSRQQLQAGVHACVADMIDSGAVTRTKVNRCMQIILNSCFHYIIPRPDGTEENGDYFRHLFAQEASDDAVLLQALPGPWRALRVDHQTVLSVSSADAEGKSAAAATPSTPKKTPSSVASTPQSSPTLASTKLSPKAKDEVDDSKRAVLLCFNENVRCAEDVFRCHNEFIRDTAHAAHLQLPAQEWRNFFGKDAAGAPYVWGNVGIPVVRVEAGNSADALGVMTPSELSKFRTTWCAKRYDHDHSLCGFAHVEVNGGWLRRNPALHSYKDKMCPHVRSVADKRISSNVFVINECPHGISCQYAHSAEEIAHHPAHYKKSMCSSVTRPSATGCRLGDACPDFHPTEAYRFPSKKTDGRPGARHSRQAGGNKGAAAALPPSGAPILLVNPAPKSNFEEQLLMPGLQSLYRRNCAVMCANLRNAASCGYSCFGDTYGAIASRPVPSSEASHRGLPQPRRK